jgi:two-component system sensor histidine kinase TctE
MLRDAPLRRQLLIWLLLPIALALAAGGWVTYLVAYRMVSKAHDRALFDAALAVAGQVRVDGRRLVVDLPQVARKILQSDLRDRVYYAVTGPSGEFLSGYTAMPLPPAAGGSVERAASLAGSPGQALYYDAVYRGQPVRVVVMAVALDALSEGRLAGPALVQVAETLVDRRDMAREVLFATLLVEVGLMLLLALIVYVVLGRTLAPLEALRRELALRSPDALTPVTEDRAPMEVRRLVHSVNDLLLRIGEAVAVQRRFVADAAHQLRTPAAALKTQLELAERATDPAQLRSGLAQVHSALDRNIRLVNQLLALARAEPGGMATGAHEPLDLVQVGRAAAEQWVPRALARDIYLGFDAADVALPIEGDPLMLGELLGNLLDNALRYTPAGGSVTVSVEPAMGEGPRPAVLLRVEDNGPGVPEAERERVFERFHRVPGSSEQPGAGLGLAIVREIALAHHGTVALGSGPGGRGTRVDVLLPRRRMAEQPVGT